MGRIEADIALESWLFGFLPSSGQGQFTLPTESSTLFGFCDFSTLATYFGCEFSTPHLSIQSAPGHCITVNRQLRSM